MNFNKILSFKILIPLGIVLYLIKLIDISNIIFDAIGLIGFICFIAGIIDLIRKKELNSKTNKKSYLIIVISILSVIIIILSIFVGMNLDMIKNKSSIIEKDEPICSFELMDVKKYQGFYETSLFFREDPMAYIVYEGLIKNNSNKKEFLKEMILQLYNEKDIFLGEGYDDINKYIEPGKSMPFKLLAKINRTNDTVLRKYYDESKELVPDIYPWFLTCK